MTEKKKGKPDYQLHFNGDEKILVLKDPDGKVEGVYGNSNVSGLGGSDRKPFDWKKDGRYLWKEGINGN